MIRAFSCSEKMAKFTPSPFHVAPIIIIDALDECDSQPAQQKYFLDTLSTYTVVASLKDIQAHCNLLQ